MYAYILIQTSVGKQGEVGIDISRLDGGLSADPVTGPYDVIVRAEAKNLDDLGRKVLARIEAVEGITRTLTCPIVTF
jgi:DNA-binding Lrp family transcriptional regulator